LVNLLAGGVWSDGLFKTGFVLCMASSAYWTISFLGEEEEDDGSRPLPQVGDHVSIAGRQGIVMQVMITDTDGSLAATSAATRKIKQTTEV